MTSATKENPNLPGPCPGAERMVWPVKTHPAQSTGLESKKNSGDGEYFSLDFSFYRTGLPPKWIFAQAQRRHFSGIATYLEVAVAAHLRRFVNASPIDRGLILIQGP